MKVKTVYETIKKIRDKNPDSIINLCSLSQGLVWAGKVKFVSGALSCEAMDQMVENITHNTDYCQSITIYVQ